MLQLPFHHLLVSSAHYCGSIKSIQVESRYLSEMSVACRCVASEDNKLGREIKCLRFQADGLGVDGLGSRLQSFQSFWGQLRHLD